MQIRDFLKIYVALVSFHLAVIYREDEGMMLWLSKPLLLFSLILYVWSKLSSGGSERRMLVLALVFSLAGDIALVFKDSASFLIGMSLFGIAQLFYSFSYIRLGVKLALLPSVLALGSSILALYGLQQLVELPKSLALPIYFYFGLISFHFIWSASAVFNRRINWYPLLGIILFIVSDWWIAWAKFGGGLRIEWHNHFAIMLTYGLAQGLIAIGFLLPRDQIGSTS